MTICNSRQISRSFKRLFLDILTVVDSESIITTWLLCYDWMNCLCHRLSTEYILFVKFKRNIKMDSQSYWMHRIYICIDFFLCYRMVHSNRVKSICCKIWIQRLNCCFDLRPLKYESTNPEFKINICCDPEHSADLFRTSTAVI